jgi:hypothetical protein
MADASDGTDGGGDGGGGGTGVSAAQLAAAVSAAVKASFAQVVPELRRSLVEEFVEARTPPADEARDAEVARRVAEGLAAALAARDSEESAAEEEEEEELAEEEEDTAEQVARLVAAQLSLERAAGTPPRERFLQQQLDAAQQALADSREQAAGGGAAAGLGGVAPGLGRRGPRLQTGAIGRRSGPVVPYDALDALPSAGQYAWPTRRLLLGDFEASLFSPVERQEVVSGCKSLTKAEQHEVLYSYPITARLGDVLYWSDAGAYDLPANVVAALRAAYRLGEARISYLEQQALSAAGLRSQSRQYWQDLQASQIEEERATPVRGELGQLHTAIVEELRIQRARATARAELARKVSSDDKPP